MSSKKPLNFAQALRAKAGESKASEIEPLGAEAAQSVSDMPAPIADFPSPVETPTAPPSEILTPENWTAGHPKLDSQTPTVDVQPSGVLDGWTSNREAELRYPSRRNRTKVTARLPSQKVEKYKLWCHLNKIDLQDAIEQGLDIITGRPAVQPSSRPGDRTPAYQHDDSDESLTTDDISSFYSRLTKNKWTENDRKALEEVSHLAPHVLKIGVVTSMLRAKQRINSFRYCLGAIQEAADSNVGVDYLDYVVSHLGKKDREGKS